ncbi:Zinc finger, C3HC4 type (RING finger) [Geosmithia morbida]|uniref:Zinc finger, C3HC4 type (RING finger) n=1 Tax=Geosmithia morbida TaxID=1094350 RepID=A0A9P5D2P8_9HYPO|nr:Zinc finger, C3HC4 type (RING finger) [Geosmithia morbida]KAF4121025.1 Zinc finger, C3HC4 type (RING finger) [Geosmithia morbida]
MNSQPASRAAASGDPRLPTSDDSRDGSSLDDGVTPYLNGSSSPLPSQHSEPRPPPMMNASNSAVGKSLPIASNYPLSTSSGPVVSSADSSRRPAQSGASNTNPTPRRGQASRKQHKNQRRPGAGGQGSNLNVDEYDALAELRAVRNPSSRRGQTSITHLLSYTSPRPYHDHNIYSRSYRRNPAWGPGSGYHASDKARYVDANYRFVVSPDVSYAQQASNTDMHLDWNNVLQVIASSTSQVTSCPICLSEPVAPRMAKCGHIFCLPCIIRFMNSSASEEDHVKPGKGPKWKKCPICEDTIYLHDIRPVRFYAGQESPLPRAGDDVVLRLMARNAHSTLALPREGGSEVLNSGHDIPWHFAANVVDYARTMKGTGDYMVAQHDEEVEALKKQEKEDETLFGQDNEWTQKAIKAIAAAKERVAGLINIESAMAAPADHPPRQSPEADFYFYSAPPHLYLSPLDIRILKTKYGSFSSFPSTLLPRVEHISTGHVVDDAMRKRAKYLGHLPRGCVVSFLECDWTEIVPADTLEAFKEDIERRRKRNRDKETQEERERIQAERIQAAELRQSAGAQVLPDPTDDYRVPPMDMSEFQPLSHPSGTSPSDPRPGFSTLASMSTSPSMEKTVWGTRAVTATGSPESVPSFAGPVNDGWLDSDIAMQAEALSLYTDGGTGRSSSAPVADSSSSGAAGGNGGGGGKKKKKQKITLMSTGGRRGL